MRDRGPTPRPELPPAMSGAFFRVAANILLRPLPPPDQDYSTCGRTGKFMVIRRCSLLEQYAPERAPNCARAGCDGSRCPQVCRAAKNERSRLAFFRQARIYGAAQNRIDRAAL